MNSTLHRILRRIYWNMPVPDGLKESWISRTRVFLRTLSRATAAASVAPEPKSSLYQAYLEQVFAIPGKPGDAHVKITEKPFERHEGDPKVIAYYLPQFHPTAENDAWWGRGVTEWNNVSRAVPQYVGHYQPRLPGELGYYDLRIKENMVRQVELAKLYGVFGFSFYYYWFDGVRLLDKPMDMFLASPDIDFPFCLCWANESWTRRFDGACGEVLMQQSETVESYQEFIASVVPYMKDHRYIRVDGRPVLIVYRPSFIPECSQTLAYWREQCVKAGVGDLYIIGVKEHTWDRDLLDHGFDAQSEFHPGTLFKHCERIDTRIDFVQPNFGGLVMDYEDIVKEKKYFKYNYKKLYRAAMPMWDNTARRDNKGMIFHGSSPELYKEWLVDIFRESKERVDLEDSFIFINAWNEWGEGTYLEPDKKYGYAYLDATRRAIEEVRQ